MWEIIREPLTQFLVTIIIALLSLLTVYVTGYINKLSKRLQEKTEIELLDNTIARLEKVVIVTVEGIEQRLAKDIRQLVKDGKVERERLTELADVALLEIKTLLGEEAVWLLEETFEDVDRLIRNYIETAVHKLKQEGK